MSEALPRSIDSKEGLLMNIPFCSEILLKFKEDKFKETKLVHPKNIPAVFIKEDVFKSSNPFKLIKLLQPLNKKSIFVTFEDSKDVKLTVSNCSQFVNVYIILVIFGEFKLDKFILIKLEHPSNIKSNVFKASSKVILI